MLLFIILLQSKCQRLTVWHKSQPKGLCLSLYYRGLQIRQLRSINSSESLSLPNMSPSIGDFGKSSFPIFSSCSLYTLISSSFCLRALLASSKSSFNIKTSLLRDSVFCVALHKKNTALRL